MVCVQRLIRSSKGPNHDQSADPRGTPPASTHGFGFNHAPREIFFGHIMAGGVVYRLDDERLGAVEVAGIPMPEERRLKRLSLRCQFRAGWLLLSLER